jgi:hypothetical protein
MKFPAEIRTRLMRGDSDYIHLMTLNTDFERSIAINTPKRLLRIMTTSAASQAISVPDPIAMPISAAASATASFKPSPTYIQSIHSYN